MTLTSTSRYTYAFDAPPDLPGEELRLLLGGKGAGLVAMAGELGLPVPPGFTITTEACRAYLYGEWPDGLDEELRASMDTLGDSVGRRFGDPSDPLLVSVRSGAPVSMPGMMDTILNLGLNSATTDGLAQHLGADFAADCLRRFREGYATVIGTADVPDDPWAQLRAAVEAVFRSWKSDRAVAYRQREGIPDELATAVSVQAMVFGNRGEDSGTGVLFTRNPSTGEREMYGDFMFNAQGEDVVAGAHATLPIAALGERLPSVYDELKRHAEVLERHFADVADIEFTVEDGRLWMLQCRVGKRSPRAALRMALDMASDPDFPLSREEAVRRVLPQLSDPPRMFVRADASAVEIARGLPASPGVASGVVATSSAEAERVADSGQSVILVRPETSPEDVRGMSKAAGVLTARGGLASHAAVVARGWGIPAVVGAEGADQRFAAGDEITIDGSTGEVFAGRLDGEWHVAPEAAELLSWAQELGVDIRVAQLNNEIEEPILAAGSSGNGLLLALAIKGSVAADQIDAGDLVAAGLAEIASDAVRLTAAGKLEAGALFAADRSALGTTRAEEQLDEFHALDGKMKQIVTAWQMRDEATFNDHSDAEYDASVLGDLAALHADTVAWLAPLGERFSRFGAYSSRLSAALAAAQGGDQRFVASPRVDSYHSVWFELHEDLIRLAGKKRSEATTG